uniref:Uncharacterized protein n=1 Tax=Anopheles farauti TaxID=69004 RepID=A0A182QIK8_9DIPT
MKWEAAKERSRIVSGPHFRYYIITLDLLHVDTTSQQIGGDQHTRRTGTELLHDNVAISLLHITVHGRDGERFLRHLLGQLVDLATGVAEYDGLRDRQRVVQIAQRADLPLLVLDVHVELPDTFQRQLLLLHQNLHRLPHEVLRNLQHVGRHRGGEQDDLHVGFQLLEHVLNLVLKTTRQHLVRLVKHEQLDVFRAKHVTRDHVMDTTRGSDHDMAALVQAAHIVAYVRAADAGVALGLQEVT